MLEAFRDLFLWVDPDVVVGFDCAEYGARTLLARSRVNHVDMNFLGRSHEIKSVLKRIQVYSSQCNVALSNP